MKLNKLSWDCIDCQHVMGQNKGIHYLLQSRRLTETLLAQKKRKTKITSFDGSIYDEFKQSILFFSFLFLCSRSKCVLIEIYFTFIFLLTLQNDKPFQINVIIMFSIILTNNCITLMKKRDRERLFAP